MYYIYIDVVGSNTNAVYNTHHNRQMVAQEAKLAKFGLNVNAQCFMRKTLYSHMTMSCAGAPLKHILVDSL